MPRNLSILAAAAVLGACSSDLLAPRRIDNAAAIRGADPGLSSWAVSPTKVSLSWPDAVTNETGWEVHRSTAGATGSFTLRATLAANTTSWADSTLVAVTEYCYKVRSFRNSGAKKTFAAFSGVSCSTTFGPPPAPSALNAAPRGGSIIDLRWTDNAHQAVNDEYGFRVERAPDTAGPWTTVVTLGPNFTFFEHGSGIMAEQLYCYRVTAFNPYGEGASNIDCTAAPNEPWEVRVTSSNATSVDISWLDRSNVEDGYEVQRDGQVVANLPANATSFHDATVSSDVVYTYRLRAKRDGGFSYYSGHVTIVAASRAPDAPVLRWVFPQSSTMAYVSWENESPLAAEFRVERSGTAQAVWVAVATIPPGTPAMGDSGLTPEEEVCYRVIAHNAVGDSPPSNVDCTRPPLGPSNLVIEGGVVTWRDNSNIEEGYLVQTYLCYPDGSSCSYEEDWMLPPNTTTFHLGGDPFGLGRTMYLGAVCALYDGGISDCWYPWSASQGTAASNPAVVGQGPLRCPQRFLPRSLNASGEREESKTLASVPPERLSRSQKACAAVSIDGKAGRGLRP